MWESYSTFAAAFIRIACVPNKKNWTFGGSRIWLLPDYLCFNSEFCFIEKLFQNKIKCIFEFPNEMSQATNKGYFQIIEINYKFNQWKQEEIMPYTSF